MKKILAMILVICMMFTATACGKEKNSGSKTERPNENPAASESVGEYANETPVQTATPVPQIVLPTATSDDVELYVVTVGGSSYIVNAYGQRANGYSRDADGNILDRQGEIVVTAQNAYYFKFTDRLTFSEREYSVELIAKEEKDPQDAEKTVVNQYSTTLTLFLTASPKDATNGVIVLGSSNPGIVEIRANNNAKIIADGAFELNAGEIAIDVGTTGSARIVVTAKTDGKASISARSIAGTAQTECIVNVKNGEIKHEEGDNSGSSEPLTEMINASGDPTVHAHSYTKTIVEPTTTEMGYTLYTCECGHSYKDNFTNPIPLPEPEETPHVHSYVVVEEKPADPETGERGYTLHRCEECGDEYKDCFVDP